MIDKYAFLARFALTHPRLVPLAWRVKRTRKTYLGYQHLFSLARNYFTVRSRHQAPVRVAEFGVGRGGSALFLAWLVQHFGGTLTLYDVFGRIPAPSDKDGERARARYDFIIKQEGDSYYGNIPDLVTCISRELSEVCDLEKVRFVQGQYEQTLPREECDPFGLVHIDCDWYESVKAVLAFLKSHLRPGGLIQVDDYSNWQGSRLAVDEASWLREAKKWRVGGPLVIDTVSLD